MNTLSPEPTKTSSHRRSYSQSNLQVHSHSLASADLRHLATPSKSAKAKHKENETWQFGWWDYIPLVEGRKPPIQWTSSSTIRTAHATEPRVICSHFPSNKQFALPSPPPLASSPDSFSPPTVLTTSARDNWIFAFFPGVGGDSVGCLWKRTPTIDTWIVKEWWIFARGAGVVAARWLNPDREWATSESGSPTRLPPLGPFIPLLNPVLLIVTETHMFNTYYAHPQTESIKMLSASLSRRSTVRDSEPRPSQERVDGPRGLGRCTHATIGLGYDESSVLVATHSSYVPSPTSDLLTSNSVDLTMSLAMSPPASEPVIFSEWETWRDENVVELCEVNVTVQGFLLSLATRPLPAIRNFPQPNTYLTDLTFVPSLPSSHHGPPLPSTPTQTHRNVTPQSSPALANTHVMQSPGRPGPRPSVKGSPPKPGLEKMKTKPTGALYLLCTTLEFGNYTISPKSEVSLSAYWRNHAALDPAQRWYYRRLSHLTVPSGVVTHLSASPSQPTLSPQHAGALIGILHTEGPILKRKERNMLAIGRLQMLRLPELQFDENWESTSITCPINPSGVELPFSLAVSPNRSLICAISLSSSLATNTTTSVHLHPMRAFHTQDFGNQKVKKQLSSALEVAVQKRVMPSDVAHVLSMLSTPIQIVEEALSAALHDFESSGFKMMGMWTNEVIGAAIEIYRQGLSTRSINLKAEDEKEDVIARYQVGLEMCSLTACVSAWEDSVDGTGYDLDAVWYLVSLCRYFIEFLEKLMKECMIFTSDESIPKDTGSGLSAGDTLHTPASSMRDPRKGEDDPFKPPGRPLSKHSPTIDISCSLIHLTHPYALDNLDTFLNHINRFRTYLASLTAKGENAEMAKEVLSDIVESSGIELDALDRAISEIKAEVKANAERAPELARRCLASLKPPALYAPLLQRVVGKILHTQVVNKSRLFIKPHDFIDGMLGLSLKDLTKKLDLDVVSKGLLPVSKSPISCVRCQGKSIAGLSDGLGPLSIRWVTWERSWLTRCICGGLWISKP